jgi:putative oxidoreductase
MGLFRLLARTTIGLLFVGHGTQKLFGWFGGAGLEGTAGFFEQLGFRPGRRYALAAGAAEAGGGLLFAFGAATPLGAAAVSGSMITAIKTVHWEKGVWVSAGGYEYNLVLLAAVFGLTENGPGTWSVDGALGRDRWGTGWALAALAGGAAGSAAVLAAAEHEAEKEVEHPAADREPVTAAS